MNLQELLDELRLNILFDRSDQTSGDSDYLWTDQTLVRYINEAQRRFAVRSLIIRDSTTREVTEVALEEGVSEYALHPAVLAVISVKHPDNRRDLARVGHSVLAGVHHSVDDWDFSAVPLEQPGPTIAFSTDEQVAETDDSTISAVVLRIYPAPGADQDGDLLHLRVCRKPLEDLSDCNMGSAPELPVDHHLDMLDWAAYLALRIVDHDAGNAKRAADFAASFEAHVQAARVMVMRKLFAPKPWGFGRAGWSWGS